MTIDEAIKDIKDNIKPVVGGKSLDMAIEALSCSEIPNNSDTISRQQSIDALRKMQTYKLFAGDDLLLIDQAEAQTELMMLPPAQPEQQWIPCSERLPKDDTEVLVYLFENNKSPYIAWLSDGRWYTEYFEVEREDEPVAWMPLPEPYKGGE